MKIDEQVRQCTSFLSIRKRTDQGDSIHPIGTAFYIGEVLGNGRAIKYAVTARHVVDASRPHGSLWVRCVRPNGRKALFECPIDSWWCHPTTDVAVAPLAIPLEEFDLRFLPLELFADDAWLKDNQVGIGDHVVAAGLFTQFIGSSKDAPIARFGRIALTPDEPIRVPGDCRLPAMEFRAILAELGSWGGQSGSPVFVYFSIDRDLFAGAEVKLVIPNPRLLGLVHGHYNFPQPVIGLSDDQAAQVHLNSGIAIVVPASEILAVLALDEAKKHRSEFVAILRQEGLLT